ncbi:hypothetical protein GQ44DRAFT_644387 [Phaeosphaeriaceae sp. PMI808]|nr:hypothetical protein GQ44DRAFT_644387 [Phaeosphaeriaceae sp. PMI808]
MEPSDTIIKLMVTQRTGDTVALNIHRGVLCKSSVFFKSAMKPEWTNLREQQDIIDLPEDSVETVSDYIRWLYSDNIPVKLHEAGEASEGTRKERAEEAERVYIQLAEAYVFGEKIVDVKYKNTVLKTVLVAKRSYNWNLGPGSVNIIYKGTSSNSPLRRLFAESVAYQARDDSEEGYGWMEYFDGYSREALVDAIKATIRLRPKPKPLTYPCDDSYLEKE